MVTRTARERQLDHPGRGEIALADVLHALADPVRLRVVRTMAAADSPMACGAFGLPVSKSTCTHHFRVLREAGIIRQHYRGTAVLNDLRRDDLDARFPGLLDCVLAAAAGDSPAQ
ncbi:ArsR/SmtB family transcription factor [Marinitenerispora sediminis]|uniref:Transcriptional regulator n=1 Tax=Marinitenerispora sediminis TaxID=1931232 RepID=A0A368T123_9ACTN|nr:helix-turn-helix domain-containing protein [Marinitenerispora sediminis]RCV49542.1 transcriptional regulator [Marinitenerispora sediminis]RCV50030.1 transcriptional regulator [Marinitenerispora sediminis]RCV53281.1 transcriptional regulator [Marinitenerispora sediminis]